MSRALWISALAAILVLGAALAAGAQDDKAGAESWMSNASQTGELVWGVINEVKGMDVASNPAASGTLKDAEEWAVLGDENMTKGEEAMKKEDYEKAAAEFNQAWQYYVKAGTSAVQSKMLLTQ